MKESYLLGMLSALLITGNVSAAVVETPEGLSIGDQFRIVFVTSTTTTASNTNISYYDQFVSDAASNAGLTSYDGNNISWNVLGSTWNSGDAINTILPSSPALYRLDGELIATSGSDLWDGTIANPINISESNSIITDYVWTGSSEFGIRPNNASRRFTLGSSSTTNFAYSGYSGSTDSGWTRPMGQSSQNYQLRHLYGISSIMTVTSLSEVPVPAAAWLFGSALAGLLVMRRKSF
jgi:hypothetical protein